MYIQPNKMLPPTSRVIRPYQCSMIATEGPNVLGKLNMSGVEIPYESQFTTRITLNALAKDQPLLYGFLGNNVTFLMLKFTYDETNPQCVVEEYQYVEYWMQDNPTLKRYANKMLLLTGNSTHRIPQIYLSNPGDVKVDVEALVANLGQSDLNAQDLQDNVVRITNLYGNSVLSDSFWNCTGFVSGSTELQILNSDGQIELYISYDQIQAITIDESNVEISIDSKSETVIFLQFLSIYEMYQASSRINWVMKFPHTRYLTIDYPSPDIQPPVLYMNTGIYPIDPSGNTYSYPFSRDPQTSGFTIYPDDILNYFVYDIIDIRDGHIAVEDAKITIKQEGFVGELTGITSVGVYDVIITVKDMANNMAMTKYIIVVNDIEPTIVFVTGVQSGFTMLIPQDCRVPADGITNDDILRKSVLSAHDSLGNNIAVSAITITIDSYSGATGITNIFIPGEYALTYQLADYVSNIVTYNINLIVSGDTVISSGETFIFGPSMTSISLVYGGYTGETATIVLSGVSFLIENVAGDLVFDTGGTNEHQFTTIGEVYTLTVNNIVYSITFDGWGSLDFTIRKVGDAPIFTNLMFQYDYRLSVDTGYTNEILPNTGLTFDVVLDGNSGSTYNIMTYNVSFNRTAFTYTSVYLESFTLQDMSSGITSGTTSGTSLFEYYVENYPTFNTTELDHILLGNAPFANMFLHGSVIEIDDVISSDSLNSIVMFGNYPKGTYHYVVDLIDDNGYTNTTRFIYTIN